MSNPFCHSAMGRMARTNESIASLRMGPDAAAPFHGVQPHLQRGRLPAVGRKHRGWPR